MKPIYSKALIILIVLMLFSCKQESDRENVSRPADTVTINDSVVGDTITTDQSEPSVDPVAAIKTEFARINAAKLTKKRYTYQCDELITIDYYYDGTQVVKAIVDYGTVGDHYQKSEFYYKDGKLIFFYDFVEGGPACEGCEMKMEQRYYVSDDKVVKYIKNDSTTQCEICAFGKRSKPYRVLATAETQDFKAALCS